MIYSGEPRGRLVHSGSLGFSLACLEVAGFIRASLSLIVAGFIRFGFGSFGRTEVTPG